MSTNQGKKFELKFAEDWKKSFPESFLLRLYDTTNGFIGIANPCDYIAFTHNKLFLCECKSTDGVSISFSAISQYERLLQYKDIPNVIPIIIVWFKEKDKIMCVPIKEAEKVYQTGVKSISLKLIDNPDYNIFEIPSVKKRIFLDADYTRILDKV